MIPPSSADIPWPYDHATAAALVFRHLPGGSRTSLTPIGEGDFCLAFRKDTRVIRVARHADAAGALRRESCALAAIADQLPLPVPRPAFHEPAIGCAFTVHQEITGAVLTRERWERLPADAQETAATDLARFLGALHAVRVEVTRSCGLPTLDRVELAARLRASAAAHLSSRLSDETGRRLDSLLARWSRPSADVSPPPAVLHCDVAPGHILFQRSTGRLTGLIDFGDVALGDPARDFIFILEDFGANVLTAVLRHYSGEDADTLLPRIRMWHLLEQVEWTLGRYANQQFADVEDGLADVTRELEVIEV